MSVYSRIKAKLTQYKVIKYLDITYMYIYLFFFLMMKGKVIVFIEKI